MKNSEKLIPGRYKVLAPQDDFKIGDEIEVLGMGSCINAKTKIHDTCVTCIGSIKVVALGFNVGDACEKGSTCFCKTDAIGERFLELILPSFEVKRNGLRKFYLGE